MGNIINKSFIENNIKLINQKQFEEEIKDFLTFITRDLPDFLGLTDGTITTTELLEIIVTENFQSILDNNVRLNIESKYDEIKNMIMVKACKIIEFYLKEQLSEEKDDRKHTHNISELTLLLHDLSKNSSNDDFRRMVFHIFNLNSKGRTNRDVFNAIQKYLLDITKEISVERKERDISGIRPNSVSEPGEFESLKKRTYDLSEQEKEEITRFFGINFDYIGWPIYYSEEQIVDAIGKGIEKPKKKEMDSSYDQWKNEVIPEKKKFMLDKAFAKDDIFKIARFDNGKKKKIVDNFELYLYAALEAAKDQIIMQSLKDEKQMASILKAINEIKNELVKIVEEKAQEVSDTRNNNNQYRDNQRFKTDYLLYELSKIDDSNIDIENTTKEETIDSYIRRARIAEKKCVAIESMVGDLLLNLRNGVQIPPTNHSIYLMMEKLNESFGQQFTDDFMDIYNIRNDTNISWNGLMFLLDKMEPVIDASKPHIRLVPLVTSRYPGETEYIECHDQYVEFCFSIFDTLKEYRSNILNQQPQNNNTPQR